MLTKNHLSYIGAVATPLGVFHYSGKPAAVDFVRREYINAHGNTIGRMRMVRPQMPAARVAADDHDHPINVLDRASVNVAPLVDDIMIDPIGIWRDSSRPGLPENLAGLQVVGDKALASGSIYYDANGSQTMSWFAFDWPLTSPSKASAWKPVNSGKSQGWAAGPMTIIPARFREALKGDVLFGQPGGLPIITRQPFGPCAITGYARDFIEKTDVPATVLLGYGECDLQCWGQGASDLWNSATVYNAIVFIGDYLLFIGRHGYGTACYGEGTSDPKIAGTPDEVGNPFCYDPAGQTKGCHAYPYRNQALGYNVSDLADVAAGRKVYNAIKPAFWFPIDVPHFDHQHYGAMASGDAPGICGAAFDSDACELHVCVFSQDSNGYEPGPLWHVFKVSGVASEPNATIGAVVAPPPTTPPVTPPPTTQPPVQLPASPDGAMAPPLAQIVDAQHVVWTLGSGNETLRDGKHEGGYGSKLLWYQGAVYTLGTDDSWWKWTGATWIPVGAQPNATDPVVTPPVVTPPVVTPPATPNEDALAALLAELKVQIAAMKSALTDTAQITELTSERDTAVAARLAAESALAAQTARLEAIRALVQQAVKVAPGNTAKIVLAPLNEALKAGK